MSPISAHRPLALLLSILAASIGFAADDPLPPSVLFRIGTTRLRHSGEIVALAFSPDGRSIATLGRDDALRLCSLADGKQMAHYRAPDGVAVCFTKDGKSILWCATHGNLYRCDAGRRGEGLYGQAERIHSFDHGSGEWTETAVFASDGSLCAEGAPGGRVQLWGRKHEKHEIKAQGDIQGLALSPNGRWLAMNKGRSGISLFAIGDRKARLGRSFGTEGVRSLAFAPDSRMLAAGNFENHIRLWDADSGRPLHLLEGHRSVPITGRNGVFCLAFSPDGATLASGGADGTVRLWDAKSGKEIVCCSGHGGRVRALAFAPDGKTVASAGADRVLRLWDAATGREVGPIKDKGGAIASLSVSADGRTLALVRMPGSLSLWDVTTGKEIPNAPQLPAPVAAAAFAADGRTLLSITRPGHLHCWDLAAKKEVRPMQNVQADIRRLAISGDGRTVAYSGGGRRVVLWDAESGKQLRRLMIEGNTTSALLFSPNGQTLIGAGQAGIRLWSARAAEPDRAMEDEGMEGRGMAISPDGRMLATGQRYGELHLWEIASGQLRRTLFCDCESVDAIAFAPGGQLLAVGGEWGMIRLWDVPRGAKLNVFLAHRGGVAAVAFAGHGSLLVTGGQDGAVLVRNMRGLLKPVRNPSRQLPERQLQTLWNDLANHDASLAYEAQLTLAQAPAQAVSLLRDHVWPVSAEKVAKLLVELDSDEFKVREQAMKELATMGKAAEKSLRKLLKSKPSLEARRRADILLEKIDDPIPAREHLRLLRAVEALEMIGTEPARQLLRRLAAGADDAPLTREAKAALARLRD